MIKKIVLSFIIVLAINYSKAEKVYEYNSTCQLAYQEITKLKLNNGIALIEKAKQQNPENLIPIYLESYVDLITLFFGEDAILYAKKKEDIANRIKLLEKGNTSSPFYKFCLSTAYLQKSLIEIKFVEFWKASWDFRKAYNLAKENKKAFATFAPNDLLVGSMQTMVATIPSGYSFFASMLGLSGSVFEGMKTIKNFVTSQDPYAKLMSTEGNFTYCFLQFHIENKKQETINYIIQKKLDLVNNHGLAFMAANLALNNKQSDLAKTIILNRSKSADFYPLPLWDYEMGFIKLYHLETGEAIKYLETYLQNFKGNFYVKDAYLKLSWAYYLQGNMEGAEAARANILKKGSSETDADKQAVKEAKTTGWPNIILLKARVLSDGGYYADALHVLAGKSISSFLKEEEKLEFTYRLGRIYDDTKKDIEAIAYYNQAIVLGAARKEYYAARAALQIAEIYERQNKKTEAIVYFEKCLSMKDHEYKNSLDQKAKSGIARCTGD